MYYIILLIKYYPYIYYLLIINDLIGYIKIMKNIYSYLKTKHENEVEKIYEVVPTDDSIDLTLEDDTCYLQYYNNKEIKEDWFIKL